ncbi:MAG: DJ-1/PfpI family protein [Thermodesulfobacteriota bacterium]
MSIKSLGIFIFDNVEVLDFAGPFEVFAVTNELNNYSLVEVFLVAETTGTISAKNGFNVVPGKSIKETDHLDILLIPGGDGARKLLNNNNVISWIKKISINCELVLSVCTGALILAKAGLLEGLNVTTHHQATGELENIVTNTNIVQGERYIDNGKVVTSAGISAGIDMSFHIIDRLFGEQVSKKTMEYMEYRILK